MTSTPANHIECEAGDGPVRRGDAVIRGDLHDQKGWHPGCYTVHRSVKGIDVEQIASEVIGGTLLERLERAGLR